MERETVLQLKDVASKVIDAHADELYDLSSEIWKNPELNFQEHYAHQVLTEYLGKKGLLVSKGTPLETSFIARFGNGKRPRLGICCEYDALPGIGHACGHNLIAEAGVAAGLGVKAALEQHPGLEGEVVVFGTPAEEGGGGKIKMIEKHCFDECDVCMMVHPAPFDAVDPMCLAICSMNVVFHGRASHAAAAPWEGVNALDAAVAFYTSVSMLRQQMKPTSRVHAIITDGGEKPNIIPRRAALFLYVRGLTDEDLLDLKTKVNRCAKAAAESAGCTVDVEETFGSLALSTNSVLADLYVKNAGKCGVEIKVKAPILGSTDMGDVSKVRPSIHPCFRIHTDSPIHTEAFALAANDRRSQPATLTAAKAMAWTCIDLLCSPELLNAVSQAFTAKS